MAMKKCCGSVRETMFCPDCGKLLRAGNGDPLEEITRHVDALLESAKRNLLQLSKAHVDSMTENQKAIWQRKLARAKLVAEKYSRWVGCMESVSEQRIK